MCIITLIPVLFTFVTSLKVFKDVISGSLLFNPTFENYIEIFASRRSNFTRLTFNSVITSTGTTLIVIAIAALGAYSLSRFKWKRFISGAVMGWLLIVHMLPPIIFVGPFYIITRQVGIYDTPLAVIMGHIVLFLPLAVWILHDFFSDVPKELEESAFVDGATRFQAFWKIVVPTTKPGIMAAGVLVFVFSFKEFLFALSLTSTPNGMTIPVGIASFVQEYNIRYGEMSAASIFASIPGIILIIFAQRHIIKGMTLGALKG
jgi:multiple sugar transport system permease protein